MKRAVNNKFLLVFKIPMFILTIVYLTVFIYNFIKNGYEFDTFNNILKVILIFVGIILLGLSTITMGRKSIIFAIGNYIVIFILIIPSIISVMPKPSDYENSNKIDNIVCSGSTDISNNSKIEITKKGNDIEKIVYIYTFDINDKAEAENVINRFDKQYTDINNIYSEITISNNVVVTFTYNMKNIDLNKLKEIDDTITTSYKDFKNKQLNNLTCKTSK